MHDGRFATLEAVIDHYSRDFKPHPNLDFRMRPLNLTDSEKAALLAFLKTLTDERFLTDPKFSDPFEKVAHANPPGPCLRNNLHHGGFGSTTPRTGVWRGS